MSALCRALELVMVVLGSGNEGCASMCCAMQYTRLLVIGDSGSDRILGVSGTQSLVGLGLASLFPVNLYKSSTSHIELWTGFKAPKTVVCRLCRGLGTVGTDSTRAVGDSDPKWQRDCKI